MAEELARRINEILGSPPEEAIRISEFQLAFHDFRRNTIDPLIQAAQTQLDERDIRAVAHSDVEGLFCYWVTRGKAFHTAAGMFLAVRPRWRLTFDVTCVVALSCHHGSGRIGA